MNKNKICKTTTDRKTYKQLSVYWDPYQFECVSLYPRWRPGFHNSGKQLPKFKIREYRTWKYNRKTQWKKNN